jgi:hypothetical protein
MRFRKLRIAFSVTCGIACVLLMVLWVRSYWWCDDLIGPLGTTQSFCFWSDHGHIGISFVGEPLKSLADGGSWAVASEWTGDVPPSKTVIPWLPSWATENYVTFPNWYLVLLMGLSIAAPWYHWSSRFSLRTLLIATTLVALILGAIVLAAR